MKEYLLELFLAIVLIMNTYGLICEFIDYITKSPIENTTTTIYMKTN